MRFSEIILIVLIILTILIILYTLILRLVHEISLPNIVINQLKQKDKTKVLSIFPHPDDETMNIGGLLNQLARDSDFDVTAVSVTPGEKGDELLKVSQAELAIIRSDEFKKALTTLGINHTEVWNFPDGQLGEYAKELRTRLENYIKEQKIDLIITYERTGLYGHGDHLVLSAIIRNIQKELGVKVLYSCMPKKIKKRLNLPKRIQYGDDVIELDHLEADEPEFKLPIFSNSYVKYKAMKTYKSQNLGQGKPIWLLALVGTYEYYSYTWEKQQVEENFTL